jgi:transcriptional accessory protein Tex/SPT6
MPNTPPHNGSHPISDVSRIAQDLQIRKGQVENVVQLLDEGNTVPFITRYRKERTGGLNEDVIRRILDRIVESRHLADRKQTVLKSIENQGKLTDQLRAEIHAAETTKRLEDLYLPYKPKKRTLATEAREKGLEPLAEAIWKRDEAVRNLSEVLPGMLNPEKQLNTTEDILIGVGHILAEQLSEMADVRAPVRFALWDVCNLVSNKVEKVSDEQGKDFRDYFAFRELIRQIPPHRILAVNRGERENILKVKLEWDPVRIRQAATVNLNLADHPQRELLEKFLDDALDRLLLPSLEREIRRELTEHAQENAVSIFARNLRSLLLQPPLRNKRVLAVDPGFKSGCKLAALDEHGGLLEDLVIHPHSGEMRKYDAKIKVEQLIRKYQLGVLALGNGTACRETEQFISELIEELEVRKGGLVPPPPPPVVIPPSVPAPVVAAPPVTPVETAPPVPPVETVPPTAQENAPSTSTETPPPSPEVAPVATEVAPPPPPVPEVAPVVQPVAENRSPVAPQPVSTAPSILDSLPAAPSEIVYVIVNEAGASDYSASPIAKEEFPDHDAMTRGTVSIGRRLQDPLAELVKIDPQHVGVGLYQHDVKPKNLKESLENVIESCVNEVGVDLNTASVPLLRHVAGLNQLVARDLVEFRQKSGGFRNRDQLKEIPGIGEARFTQAAGFLKIPSADEPLDNTWIHPESYGVARQLLSEMGFSSTDLRDKDKLAPLQEKLKQVNVTEVATRLNCGEPTIRDIIDNLSRPGRDPREDRPPPIFKKGILKLEDLQPGMELKGTVLNVVPFGAFVDIGLKDTGLVHISQMANRYIKNPYEIVAVGDVVTVWVIKVEGDRRRASLTMIPPGSERKPHERRPAESRPPRAERPQGEPPPHGEPRPHGERRPKPDRPAGDRSAGDHAPGGERPTGPPRQPQRSGPPQRSGGGAPYRGGPPRQGGGGPRPPYRGGAPGEKPTELGKSPQQPAPPPPPPRKPPKPKPLPKLSSEALKGASPLHTFGELEAFFKARETPEPPKEPPAAHKEAPPPEPQKEAPPPEPINETPPQVEQIKPVDTEPATQVEPEVTKSENPS